MMHAGGLQYGDLRLRVETDSPSHLRWLVNCLQPVFTEGEATAGAAARVRLIHDAARHRELLARGPAPDGGCVPCFMLDSQIVRHPLWRGPNRKRVIHDTEYRLFYVVEGAAVDIIADGSSRWSRVALFRVVREVALALARADTLSLHAAAAVVGTRGILLAGPKRAGKTSLLIHLLGHPDARLVANDRVLVRDADSAVSFTGVPTMVKIREGTLRLFPDRLGHCDRHADLACGCDGELPCEPDLPRGLLLNPAQFAGLVGCDRAAGASLDAVVFPRVADAAAISVRSLAPEEAARRLEASIFGVGTDIGEGTALAPDTKVTLEGLAERCGRLAARVPSIECVMGPSAFLSDPGAAGLVAELLA